MVQSSPKPWRKDYKPSVVDPNQKTIMAPIRGEWTFVKVGLALSSRNFVVKVISVEMGGLVKAQTFGLVSLLVFSSVKSLQGFLNVSIFFRQFRGFTAFFAVFYRFVVKPQNKKLSSIVSL